MQYKVINIVVAAAVLTTATHGTAQAVCSPPSGLNTVHKHEQCIRKVRKTPS
jgi:hypothetical protein